MVLATYKHLSTEQYILATVNKINAFILIQSLIKKIIENYHKNISEVGISKHLGV